MSELEKEQPVSKETSAASRRDFIKLAGALAGAAGVTKLFMVQMVILILMDILIQR